MRDSDWATHEVNRKAGVAQLVEHQPSKLRVASSNLVSRSVIFEAIVFEAIAEISVVEQRKRPLHRKGPDLWPP